MRHRHSRVFVGSDLGAGVPGDGAHRDHGDQRRGDGAGQRDVWAWRLGGGFGTRPPGSRTAFPTTLPSGAQPGGGFRPGTVRGFGDIVSGKVTSVAGSSIAVAEPSRGPSGASGSTTPATVTVTSATTYTTTKSATKAALAVGKCMTAFGKADTTGAVTATRVALSTAGPNGCSTGFGFGRGRFGSSPTTGG